MTTELEPAVRTLIEAANANDLTAFLAGLTGDGVVNDWGREFRGADEIRGWSDAEFIGKQVSLTVRRVERRDRGHRGRGRQRLQRTRFLLVPR